MRAAISRGVLVGLVVTAAGTVSCAAESPSSSDDPRTGGVGVELRISRTTHINRVHYELTGPNAFSASGALDVSNIREAEGAIRNVPEGGPYGLILNATSTDGNVFCIGSKSAISVGCPGNRSEDEKTVKLVCMRNHVGREWGDKDWRENERTFFVGAELNLVCPPTDAGVDTGTVDTGTDADTTDAGLDGEASAADGAADADATDAPGTPPDGGSDADSGTSCGLLGPLSTTACIFQAQDKPTSQPQNVCSACVLSNSCYDPLFNGGTCETLTGTAALLAGTLPDGKTCAQVFGASPVSETAVCLQSLQTIFGSRCAASLQETPCLCGATPVNLCSTCQATPTGPLFDAYACDIGTTNTCQILPDLTIPYLGVGQANTLVQCAASFGCDCF